MTGRKTRKTPVAFKPLHAQGPTVDDWRMPADFEPRLVSRKKDAASSAAKKETKRTSRAALEAQSAADDEEPTMVAGVPLATACEYFGVTKNVEVTTLFFRPQGDTSGFFTAIDIPINIDGPLATYILHRRTPQVAASAKVRHVRVRGIPRSVVCFSGPLCTTDTLDLRHFDKLAGSGVLVPRGTGLNVVKRRPRSKADAGKPRPASHRRAAPRRGVAGKTTISADPAAGSSDDEYEDAVSSDDEFEDAESSDGEYEDAVSSDAEFEDTSEFPYIHDKELRDAVRKAIFTTCAIHLLNVQDLLGDGAVQVGTLPFAKQCEMFNFIRDTVVPNWDLKTDVVLGCFDDAERAWVLSVLVVIAALGTRNDVPRRLFRYPRIIDKVLRMVWSMARDSGLYPTPEIVGELVRNAHADKELYPDDKSDAKTEEADDGWEFVLHLRRTAPAAFTYSSDEEDDDEAANLTAAGASSDEEEEDGEAGAMGQSGTKKEMAGKVSEALAKAKGVAKWTLGKALPFAVRLAMRGARMTVRAGTTLVGWIRAVIRRLRNSVVGAFIYEHVGLARVLLGAGAAGVLYYCAFGHKDPLHQCFQGVNDPKELTWPAVAVCSVAQSLLELASMGRDVTILGANVTANTAKGGLLDVVATSVGSVGGQRAEQLVLFTVPLTVDILNWAVASSLTNAAAIWQGILALSNPLAMGIVAYGLDGMPAALPATLSSVVDFAERNWLTDKVPAPSNASDAIMDVLGGETASTDKVLAATLKMPYITPLRAHEWWNMEEAPPVRNTTGPITFPATVRKCETPLYRATRVECDTETHQASELDILIEASKIIQSWHPHCYVEITKYNSTAEHNVTASFEYIIKHCDNEEMRIAYAAWKAVGGLAFLQNNFFSPVVNETTRVLAVYEQEAMARQLRNAAKRINNPVLEEAIHKHSLEAAQAVYSNQTLGTGSQCSARDQCFARDQPLAPRRGAAPASNGTSRPYNAHGRQWPVADSDRPLATEAAAAAADNDRPLATEAAAAAADTDLDPPDSHPETAKEWFPFINSAINEARYQFHEVRRDLSMRGTPVRRFIHDTTGFYKWEFGQPELTEEEGVPPPMSPVPHRGNGTPHDTMERPGAYPAANASGTNTSGMGGNHSMPLHATGLDGGNATAATNTSRARAAPHLQVLYDLYEKNVSFPGPNSRYMDSDRYEKLWRNNSVEKEAFDKLVEDAKDSIVLGVAGLGYVLGYETFATTSVQSWYFLKWREMLVYFFNYVVLALFLPGLRGVVRPAGPSWDVRWNIIGSRVTLVRMQLKAAFSGEFLNYSFFRDLTLSPGTKKKAGLFFILASRAAGDNQYLARILAWVSSPIGQNQVLQNMLGMYDKYNRAVTLPLQISHFMLMMTAIVWVDGVTQYFGQTRPEMEEKGLLLRLAEYLPACFDLKRNNEYGVGFPRYNARVMDVLTMWFAGMVLQENAVPEDTETRLQIQLGGTGWRVEPTEKKGCPYAGNYNILRCVVYALAGESREFQTNFPKEFKKLPSWARNNVIPINPDVKKHTNIHHFLEAFCFQLYEYITSAVNAIAWAAPGIPLSANPGPLYSPLPFYKKWFTEDEFRYIKCPPPYCCCWEKKFLSCLVHQKKKKI